MSRATDPKVNNLFRVQDGKVLASGDDINWYPREDVTKTKEILRDRVKNKPLHWWKAQAIHHTVTHQSEYHQVGEQSADWFMSVIRQAVSGAEPSSAITTTRDGKPRMGPRHHAPLLHPDAPDEALSQFSGAMPRSKGESQRHKPSSPLLQAKFTYHISHDEPGTEIHAYTAELSVGGSYPSWMLESPIYRSVIQDPPPPVSVFEFDLTLTVDVTTKTIYGVFRIADIEGVFRLDKCVLDQECTISYWAKDFQSNQSRTGLGGLTCWGPDGIEIEGDFAKFSDDGRAVRFRAQRSPEIKVNESWEVLKRECARLY